jgi:hypothetical protein
VLLHTPSYGTAEQGRNISKQNRTKHNGAEISVKKPKQRRKRKERSRIEAAVIGRGTSKLSVDWLSL